MIWESRFNIGDRVYLRHADENIPGFVIQVAFDGGASPRCSVSWSNRTATWHNEFELTDTYVSSFTAEAE